MKRIFVVGGGAAGMLAAYGASLKGNCEVVLFERNEKLGKKVFITGKGRCNITNHCDVTDFFSSVLCNEKFLYSSIYGFDNTAMVQLLSDNGCPVKVERGGRVFPVSDHSSDVIRALENLLIKNKVQIRKDSFVKKLMLEDTMLYQKKGKEIPSKKVVGLCVLDRKGKEEYLKADKVILATGGLSYPSTGSDGNFHTYLKSLGVSISKLRPGLVPLESTDMLCKQLQGLSLKNVQVQITKQQKMYYSAQGEMLFTHFGLSGPLILSAASDLQHSLDEIKGCEVHIDLKPALPSDKLDKRIVRELEENANKQLKNVMPKLLPGKLAALFPDLCQVNPDTPCRTITKEERKRLVTRMKDLVITVTGTRPFSEAIITIGGVDVKTINPSTMESKSIPNLYFAGELLDVDAYTGGFNLQIAWSTGYLAGSSAAESLDEFE